MKKIVLKDYRFKLGVKRYDGIIHAEQGIPMFYCAGEGVVARLTFPVCADDYEEPLTAYIRNGEDEVILSLDSDDILLEDLREDMLDVTENTEYLSDLLNEERVRFVPKVLQTIGSTILTLIAGIALMLFKQHMLGGVAFGVTLAQFIVVWRGIKVMSDTRIYDKRGRWVDVATGDTNLNGGYRLDLSYREG